MSCRAKPWAVLAVVTWLASVPAAALAEWDRQRMNPQDQDKAFLDVSAVSPSFAAAAGMIKQGGQDAAAVFITRDGLNWSNSSPQTSGGPMDIHIYSSVWFANERLGYVGGLGEIWVTDDGGATWTRVGLGGLMGGRMINDIAGLRPSGRAWAVTSTGQVLMTIDGGDTWPEVDVPLGGAGLNRVAFVDDQHGWVVSGAAITTEEGEITGFEDGGLALSEDGGLTWQTVFSGESRKVISLRFIDTERGWILSRSLSGYTLERTTDGGLTWEPVSLPASSGAGAVSGFGDVAFFSGCEGLILGAVGDNDWGTVWSTRDGGATWIEADREFLRLGQFMGFPIEAGLVTFDFVDRTVGWASGTNETLFRYDADDEAPPCDGGGDGSDGGGGSSSGGRCGCRAAGAHRAHDGGLGLAVLLVAAAWVTRRRALR